MFMPTLVLILILGVWRYVIAPPARTVSRRGCPA
jgi:hypothetical protein